MKEINFIPLMSPDIQEHDIEAVVEVLKSGMLVQGAKVETLEKVISEYLNIKHAVAVSNGTATLHLALIAMGIGAGDEVIVPALSYIATANVVELVGATPIFVDVSIDTFNIDTDKIVEKITAKTKAIIPVHEFGLACDIEKVVQIAKQHNLLVIEDAACALGATENGNYVGTFGDVGSFSFHPRKAITGGEGGLLVTNNDELAEKFRILRNHGVSAKNGKMEFVAAGFNYRMTDFQAALIHSQFLRIEKILDYRNELANIYLKELKHVNGIKLPSIPVGKRHTWQSFHIVVNNEIPRDELITKLRAEGIGTNYGAQCIPYQTYFLNKYKLDSVKHFPNALKAYQNGLVLPLYEKMTLINIEKIINSLVKCKKK